MHVLTSGTICNETEESIILFTQIKSKNKTQKKLVYVMAALLGAVVGSIS